ASATRFGTDYVDTFAGGVRADVLDQAIIDQLDAVGYLSKGENYFFIPPGGHPTPIQGFLASEFVAMRTNGTVQFKNDDLIEVARTLRPHLVQLFGGDFNPTKPCRAPNPNVSGPGVDPTINQIRGTENTGFCFPDGSPNPDFDLDTETVSTKTHPAGFGTNRRIEGGTGENPFRPGPDVGLFGSITPGPDKVLGTADDVRVLDDNTDLQTPQGLYYPSAGLRAALASGDLDSLDVNFTEYERAFNRGQSQQDEGELKEAYLDLEFLDSRLWARIGKQNIVWGKTELFRTTDQFNPQDLALSSLPSLEESRIALWSGRFVYSLYDLWEFEDVRLEFAFNFDQYQPADLGACGEPYTINIACGIPFGAAAHSILGIGLAGIDRPDNPWDNFKGIEFGGRIEWRWSRFSFAITEFLGYDDLPYVDTIFSYERNVDPTSGRPRIAGNHVDGSCPNVAEILNPYQVPVDSIQGVGTAAGCLKPGGAPGEAGANGLGDSGGGVLKYGIDSFASPENALYYHHANQQIFAVLCSATTSISALDASACAFNIFASGEPLAEVFDPQVPLMEVFSAFLAGEPDRGQAGSTVSSKGFNLLIAAGATGDKPEFVPLRNLNSEQANFLGKGIGLGVGVSNLVSYPKLVAAGSIGFEGALSLDSTLSAHQRAMLGCGPYWGTRCDTTVESKSIFGAQLYPSTGGGGIDFLNSEASALLQAWPGVEGTGTPGLNGFTGSHWSMIDRAFRQPGTVGFDGGPVATRFDPSEPGGLAVLPGARGIAKPDDFEAYGHDRNTSAVEFSMTEIRITFQKGYNPLIDGCVTAHEIKGRPVVGEFISTPGSTPTEFALTKCGPLGADPPNQLFGLPASTSRHYNPDPNGNALTVMHADTLYHPLAGCILTDEEVTALEAASGQMIDAVYPCIQPYAPLLDAARVPLTIPRAVYDALEPGIMRRCGVVDDTSIVTCGERDFDTEFVEEGLGGRTQLFQSELAAFSFNFMNLLVVTSCNEIDDDKTVDLDCFDPRIMGGENLGFSEKRCSFAAPHFCRNVKGFLNIGGVSAPVIRAGGNGRFGRRTFSWHGGREAVLRYDRRNVLGFSMDFAEDVSKSNWGMEFTWIEGSPFSDGGVESGVTRQDTLNLTISVDRPTFINFMNANRTFFFNSQWFFQYQTNYKDTFFNHGPFNVLFTFAMFTGYFQDRLLPNLITVYDFNSKSGGVLPNVTYRFTDVFSIDWGFLLFFGRTELRDMPINSIGPPTNRAGANAYKVPVDNLLSLVRHRDEVFLRLRYTF
ncbi:MAG: hypothetical protein HRU01_00385, partial [Myxococcales bacterium]|nr:hypothetical protein [Myxococcales bacterium]